MRKLRIFFLLIPVFASGQPPVSGNANLSSSIDSAANIYFASQAKTLALHNGRVFYGYPGIIGFAFYPTKSWQKGSILYDGTWYHDISMMYDIYKDQVVALHPNTTSYYLFSERVQKFNYDTYTFVRLNPDKDNVLKSGFYQQLAEGNVTIFVRRHKKIQENIVDLTLERKFIFYNTYYALKDGKYLLINKQKTLLSLVKDKKQAIVKHLKQQKLKYKQDEEKTITAIAEFYNQSYK